jgi:hypothetical protein
MSAHSSGHVTSFVSVRDGVRWRKILHLTGYDVSDAVHTPVPLDLSMSKQPMTQEQSRNPCTLSKKSVKLCHHNHGVAQYINSRPPTAQNIRSSQGRQ